MPVLLVSDSARRATLIFIDPWGSLLILGAGGGLGAGEDRRTALIEVKNLTKLFGDKPVVDHISFTVNKGEILGFLGPNGAGKTTTMRMLTRFLPATSGTASVAGAE